MGKAPGKYYREGLSLVDLMRTFPDDAAAEAWFVSARWAGGVRCPRVRLGERAGAGHTQAATRTVAALAARISA